MAENPANAKGRRAKSGNSQLFNDILSAANALSVAERTRLVKSLAGQLGLLTVGGQSLVSAGSKESKKPKSNKAPKGEPVRPNPLKGTMYEQEKEAAKAALVKARDEAQGAQLPGDHPAVVAYAKALSAYKTEKDKLKPVTGQPTVVLAHGGKTSKKRGASKSPVRDGASEVKRGAAGIASAVSNAVQSLRSSRGKHKTVTGSQDDNEMDEE